MTFVTGSARFKTPLLFIAGFIFMFVAGGLTGIMFLAVPFDQQVTDTYFVIAHFHYIIFGAAVFPIFGGLYFWFPKVTGRLYFELPGQISFWIIFVGTNLLFFPMHIVGLLGMPRRDLHVPGRARLGGRTTSPRRSAASSRRVGILRAARQPRRQLLPRRARRARPVARRDARVDDSSPPPEYNFAVIPKVSSAYANWDYADREEDRRKLAAGNHRARAGARAAGDAPPSTAVGRDRRDAARFALADPARARAVARVRVLLLLQLGSRRLLGARLVLALLGWHATSRRRRDWLRRRRGAGAASRARRAATRATALVARRPAAWWGMAILSRARRRSSAPSSATLLLPPLHSAAWPPPGDPEPERGRARSSSSACSRSTSVPMQLASRAAARRPARARRGLLVVGARRAVRPTSPTRSTTSRPAAPARRRRDNAYSSIYYTLLGADHAHVALGILLDVWLLWKLARGPDDVPARTPLRRSRCTGTPSTS